MTEEPHRVCASLRYRSSELKPQVSTFHMHPNAPCPSSLSESQDLTHNVNIGVLSTIYKSLGTLYAPVNTEHFDQLVGLYFI